MRFFIFSNSTETVLDTCNYLCKEWESKLRVYYIFKHSKLHYIWDFYRIKQNCIVSPPDTRSHTNVKFCILFIILVSYSIAAFSRWALLLLKHNLKHCECWLFRVVCILFAYKHSEAIVQLRASKTNTWSIIIIHLNFIYYLLYIVLHHLLLFE